MGSSLKIIFYARASPVCELSAFELKSASSGNLLIMVVRHKLRQPPMRKSMLPTMKFQAPICCICLLQPMSGRKATEPIANRRLPPRYRDVMAERSFDVHPLNSCWFSALKKAANANMTEPMMKRIVPSNSASKRLKYWPGQTSCNFSICL